MRFWRHFFSPSILVVQKIGVSRGRGGGRVG